MIESHVTSLELSKKLKEAGFPQKSEFYWCNGYYVEDVGWMVFSDNGFQIHFGLPSDYDRYGEPSKEILWYSSLLSSELLMMLPDSIGSTHEEHSDLKLYNDCGTWFCSARPCSPHFRTLSIEFNGDEICTAVADMLLHLAKEGIIDPKGVE